MDIQPSQSNPLGIDENRLYKSKEICRLLRVSETTLCRYISSRALPAIKTFGNWKILGKDLLKFVDSTKKSTTFLEYPSDQLKFPHISFLLYHMIIGKYNAKYIQVECANYGLVVPTIGELDQLWESLKKTAPQRIYRQMAANARHTFDFSRADSQSWVMKLGIRDMFETPVWPCQNILEDMSEKRMQIEILMCGRVIHKEIVDYMAAKYNFIITVDQLDFFGRHFFNTYNYNTQDRILYLGRLTNRSEIYHKQRAWGDPVAAKTVLQIPTRVNVEETLNMLMAMAAVNYRDFAMDRESMPLAKDAAQIIIQSHRQLLALEKQRSEQVAVATQKAQQEGVKMEAFEQKSEEPPSFSDLDQPSLEGSEPEAKVG